MSEEPSNKIPYARGPHNRSDDKEQWIRISEGCPNNCPYCRETKECGKDPIYFEIPEIVRNHVKIMDMNLLYKPKALDIIKELGAKRVNNKVVYYELICGIDYRYLTDELAEALHQARFKDIRIAWDYGFKFQKDIKLAIRKLTRAGYKANSLSVFMICNWKTPFKENMMKLDLFKVWNVKVDDCWYDNQQSPNVQPVFWAHYEIPLFRSKVRKHNHLVLYGIDPEYETRGDKSWKIE